MTEPKALTPEELRAVRVDDIDRLARRAVCIAYDDVIRVDAGDGEDGHIWDLSSKDANAMLVEQLQRAVRIAIAEALRERDAEIERLRAALEDIAKPRASVDMADAEDDQQRDALHALAMCRSAAREALARVGKG